MAIMTNNPTINRPSPQTDQTTRRAGRLWLPLEGTRDDRVRRIHVAGRIPRVEYGDTECVQGTAAGYEHIEINMIGMNGDEQLGGRMSVTATKRTLLHSADQVLGANSEDDQPVCREMVAVLVGTKPRTLHLQVVTLGLLCARGLGQLKCTMSIMFKLRCVSVCQHVSINGIVVYVCTLYVHYSVLKDWFLKEINRPHGSLGWIGYGSSGTAR